MRFSAIIAARSFCERLKYFFDLFWCLVMNNRFKKVSATCPYTGITRTVSPRFAALVTGRSLRTAQRWANGGNMDTAAREVLRLRVFGVLPGDAWRDFRLRGDFLENVASGETWTPAQLHTAWISWQLLREYQRHTPTKKPARLAGNVSLFQAG